MFELPAEAFAPRAGIDAPGPQIFVRLCWPPLATGFAPHQAESPSQLPADGSSAPTRPRP